MKFKLGGCIGIISMCLKFGDDPLSSLDFSFPEGFSPYKQTGRVWWDRVSQHTCRGDFLPNCEKILHTGLNCTVLISNTFENKYFKLFRWCETSEHEKLRIRKNFITVKYFFHPHPPRVRGFLRGLRNI